MIDLILKKLVKNYKNTENPKVRAAYGKLSGVVGIILNVILFIIKFIAATLGGGLSVAIFADALNNLTDASSSVVSLLGFKLSEKPADKEHPYGHGRYEYLSALTVSAVIIVIGVELFRSAIGKIINPTVSVLKIGTVAILVISIFIKIALAVFNYSLGRRISSQALIATATDSRNDVIATGAVLVSLVISHFISFNLDGYMAVLVSLFIVYSGFTLIKDTITTLLGKAPDKELVDMIVDRVESYPHVLGIHDLMIHDYGPGRIFGSVHVEMPCETDVLTAHNIIDDIEKDLLYNDNINIIIHYDPVVTNDPRATYYKGVVNEIVKTIDPAITIHDFRMVPGESHTNLIFDCVLPFGFKAKRKHLKEIISKKVLENHPNHFCVITFEFNYTEQ